MSFSVHTALMVLLLAAAAASAVNARSLAQSTPENVQPGLVQEEAPVMQPQVAVSVATASSSITKKVILTDKAPSPLGPYSQAIKVSGGSTLYIAGQIGLIPGTTDFAAEDITGQTTQTLKNIGAILKAAGGDFSNVVKCTIYLADMADFAAMNAVYATFFNVPKPAARAAFAAGGLPKAAKVEIECNAVV